MHIYSNFYSIMKAKHLSLLVLLGVLVSCSNPGEQQKSSISGTETLDRTVLPIQPPAADPITEMDARNATKPERFEVKAPEGAPNVVVVLIDDIGFGATTAWQKTVCDSINSIPLPCAHQQGHPCYPAGTIIM
jgi:hypothetical protein